MKMLFSLLMLLCSSGYLSAQVSAKTTTLTQVIVPETVKNSFAKEFPSIQPKWENDLKNFKAVYTDPKTNTKGIIVYDMNGKVVRRESETNTVQTPNAQ